MCQNPSSATTVIGIDIGKNSFHVVGLDDRGAIILRQKWSRGDRYGSLRRCASSQSEAERIWSRRSIDTREVCSPVLKGTEERLPRCGSDRRSSPAANHEVCGNEDRRTARPASPASCTRATGQPAHWHHQSNSRLGAWPFDRDCGYCALSCPAS